MPPPTPVSSQWTQEIRFAVVLYGGVSLAIYINGVVQELFRMVRATADLPPGESLSGTELLYRELGQVLFYGREPNARATGQSFPAPSATDPVRTRFVVDILSGTSAGGINAVALAKALTLKCRDIDHLKRLWIEDAEIHTLLNDEASDLRRYPSGDRTTSLLNSEKMYRKLYEGISGLNEKAAGKPGPGFADAIDLFVTATDLHGLDLPIALADRAVSERVHRHVFHFRYEDPLIGGRTATSRRPHDFGRELDPMLAFAARCTSAFPVAFEPMVLSRIEPVLKESSGLSLETALTHPQFGYQDFFQAYVDQNAPYVDRPFADGGYLDNKPFSYAIDLIQYRASCRPAQRKLLYVDPFPEIANERKPNSEIGFLENAYLAAMGLPRYETIRGDIETINRSNRLQDRITEVRDRLEVDKCNIKEAPAESSFREDYRTLDLNDMRKWYGDWYPLYQHLMVYSATDFIARVMTVFAGFHAESDEYFFIRDLIRAWRKAHYCVYREGGKETENAFLADFDLDYRMRRLNWLVERIDNDLDPREQRKRLSEKPDTRPISVTAWWSARGQASTELARLADLRRRLVSGSETLRLASEGEGSDLVRFPKMELAEAFVAFAQQRDFEQRRKYAEGVYEKYKIWIDALADSLRDKLKDAFDGVRTVTTQALAGTDLSPLAEAYARFSWHDMVSFALLEGANAREYSQIEVYRISPADGTLRPNGACRGLEKLAGTAVANFGGFLQQSWRWNDMMWGRLDGAERIITALLPDPRDKELRDFYIRRLQDQILDEEVTSDRISQWLVESLADGPSGHPRAGSMIQQLTKMLSAATPLARIVNLRDKRAFITEQFQVPHGPSRENATDWASRALKIFGRMIDDLPGSDEKRFGPLSRTLQSSGVLLSQVARFGVPGSLGSRFLEYWLALIALAGLLLVAAGPLLGVPQVSSVGFVALAGSGAFWLVQRLVGMWLKRSRYLQSIVVRVGGVIAVVLLLAVFVVGASTTWNCVQAPPAGQNAAECVWNAARGGHLPSSVR